MINYIKRYLQNFPGPSVARKILIFESDDWGSIRMPSQKVYKLLEKSGYNPQSDHYLRYDSLASENDIEALIEVLLKFKDRNGFNAAITANCVVGNPNFDEISRSGFQEYHYELFTETLKRYPQHEGSFSLWNEAISEGVFKPQFHGREHLNVYRWMKALQEDDKLVHEAFNNEMISISSLPSSMRFHYMEGLDYFSQEEKTGKKEILQDGLKQFYKLFGYRSTSFIANCYIWDSDDEAVLSANKVQVLQGVSNQLMPSSSSGYLRHKRVRHFFGQRNNNNQLYSVRNVFFEPSLNPNVDWVSDALKRIDVAFRCKKPAIIGTHRLNYIGYIDEGNRTRNLKMFKELLNKVLMRWPDVEFTTTDRLLDYL